MALPNDTQETTPKEESENAPKQDTLQSAINNGDDADAMSAHDRDLPSKKFRALRKKRKAPADPTTPVEAKGQRTSKSIAPPLKRPRKQSGRKHKDDVPSESEPADARSTEPIPDESRREKKSKPQVKKSGKGAAFRTTSKTRTKADALPVSTILVVTQPIMDKCEQVAEFLKGFDAERSLLERDRDDTAVVSIPVDNLHGAVMNMHRDYQLASDLDEDVTSILEGASVVDRHHRSFDGNPKPVEFVTINSSTTTDLVETIRAKIDDPRLDGVDLLICELEMLAKKCWVKHGLLEEDSEVLSGAKQLLTTFGNVLAEIRSGARESTRTSWMDLEVGRRGVCVAPAAVLV